jgi:hypothetical protein
VSREAAIADDGVLPPGALDHDVMSQDAAATDRARTSRPPSFARLSGLVSFADVAMVAA